MKILITGAHFTPAVAVIEELKKYKQTEIIYVGRKTTMEGDSSPSAESQILPTLGVKYISLTAGRLQRTFTFYTIFSLLKIPLGFIQALWIIIKEKPDVILSFGGYVSVPVVFAGWLFSKPILIHEQTLVTGLANKINAYFADKIALSFDGKNNFDKDKTILTGNPIRKNILERHVELTNKKREKPTILITGGNQGSHVINLAVEKSLNKLKKIALIIHATGDSKFKDFERLEKKQDDHYIVRKWISDEWGDYLNRADLVISRAGINTLTEMATLRKPGLVIPIPFIFADEQNKNARFFQDLGLVRMLPQSKLSEKTFLKNIKEILGDLDNFKKKATEAKKVIIPDAAKRLAFETILLTKPV